MSAIIEVVDASNKRAFYHQECYTPTKGEIVYGVLRLRDGTHCHTCKGAIPAGPHTREEEEPVVVKVEQLTLP